MKNYWLIRCGTGGTYLKSTLEHKCVGINFGVGDLSGANSREDVYKIYKEAHPDTSEGTMRNGTGQLFRFYKEVAKGDTIVTYANSTRLYHLGEVTSDYRYELNLFEGCPHRRAVDWNRQVNRDRLSVSSRNSLGAIMTLFLLNEDTVRDFESVLDGNNKASIETEKETAEDAEQVDEIRQSVIEQANEFLKDRIVALGPNDMERLVAHLLRAMGYRSKVSPIGPDRGVDVTASPDGLGFTQPRIKAEVKHQPNSSKGSQDLRSFIGALREGDCGLYVSTGSFTKEAKYEAERANHPVTLIDLDSLASLIKEHYEHFDAEGRNLLPLDRIYWPRD